MIGVLIFCGIALAAILILDKVIDKLCDKFGFDK